MGGGRVGVLCTGDHGGRDVEACGAGCAERGEEVSVFACAAGEVYGEWVVSWMCAWEGIGSRCRCRGEGADCSRSIMLNKERDS